MSTSRDDAVYAKVTARIVPLLFAGYVVAYLDRVNVGFAKLQMQADLHLSDAAFATGAGIFFIGYFLFEVPSNLILHRVGARVWIARIMITWGVLSAAFMWTTSVPMFYALRFLLGVSEAGFFPGVILFLTAWFPAARRTRITALFMSAIAVSGIVGSPLSGWVLKSFAGLNGWAGWQWLFLIEGVPSIVMGIVIALTLDDRISAASWLTTDEKALLERRLADEHAQRTHALLRDALTDPRIALLSLIYFTFVIGLYGVSFWLPTLIKNLGVSDSFHIGLLTAIPYVVAMVGMIALAKRSDRTRQRRAHACFAAMLGAVGLVAAGLTPTWPAVAIAALSVATLGILASFPLFWALPTNFLGGRAAAAGIALINSFGNLGGYVGPSIPPWVKAWNPDPSMALYAMAACLTVGAVLSLTVPAKLVDR